MYLKDLGVMAARMNESMGLNPTAVSAVQIPVEDIDSAAKVEVRIFPLLPPSSTTSPNISPSPSSST